MKNFTKLTTQDQLRSLFEGIAEDLQEQIDYPEINDSKILDFIASLGCGYRKLRKVTIKKELAPNLAKMLFTPIERFQANADEKDLQLLSNFFLAFAYFIELDYDSPSLRRQEKKTWVSALKKIRQIFQHLKATKEFKPKASTTTRELASDLIELQKSILKIKKRTKQRLSYERLKKHFSSKVGQKADRRDLHGILLLNFALKKILMNQTYRVSPFVAKTKLTNSHQSSECKLNPCLAILHIMTFLGIDSTEESILKNIKTYDKKYSNGEIVLPSLKDLILEPEADFWKIVYNFEVNNKLPPIPIEPMIYKLRRLSLIGQLKCINKVKLAKIIADDRNIEDVDLANDDDVNCLIASLNYLDTPRNC